MKFRFLLILLLVSVFNNLFSQGAYRKGFIVTLEKDTVPGLILYKEIASRFSTCAYKKEPNTESIIYTPDKISGYGFVNDRYYTSKEITVDSVKQNYFAEILVLGQASLLQVQEKFFLDDNKGKLYELTVKTTEIVNENGRFSQTIDLYAGILRWKFSDCPKASNKVNSTKFNEKSLTQIFELYNSCFNTEQKSFKSTKPWSETHIGLSGGVCLTILKNLENTYFASIIDIDEFKKNIGFLGGLVFTYSSPRISEKLVANIGIQFQQFTHESVLINGNSREEVFLKYNSLQTPITFNYLFNFKKSKIVPSIEVGLNVVTIFDATSSWQHETILSDNSVITNETDDYLRVHEGISFPIIVGIGASKDISKRTQVFIKFRYQFGMSAINPAVTEIQQHSSSLSAGALFKVSK